MKSSFRLILFNNISMQIENRDFCALPDKSQRGSFDLKDFITRKFFISCEKVFLEILNQ